MHPSFCGKGAFEKRCKGLKRERELTLCKSQQGRMGGVKREALPNTLGTTAVLTGGDGICRAPENAVTEQVIFRCRG